MGAFDTYVPSETLNCFRCAAPMTGAWFQGKDSDCWLDTYSQGVKPQTPLELFTGYTFGAACPACKAWSAWSITVVDGVWVSSAHNHGECFT